MDKRIFDRLDRMTPHGNRPLQNIPPSSVFEYIGSDGYVPAYQGNEPMAASYYHAYDDPVESFDQRVLAQPDYDTRQGQATMGRARLSLPPAGSRSAMPHNQSSVSSRDTVSTQRPALQRYTYESECPTHGISSPMMRGLPSSPSFAMNHRKPARNEQEHSVSSSHHIRQYRQSRQVNTTSSLSAEQEEHDQPQSYQQPPASTRREPAIANQTSKHSTPIVQGVNLVPTRELPDRFRAIFPFPLFNATQSKCFNTIYKTNDNFVLSSPTGSGKTAVLELAICRLINSHNSGSFKIVYQAPTKALCSERQRDWQAKFRPLDLQCAELTGDTDNAQLRNVQHASIIVTTPEKWDSITRKWKDHRKLMRMVKLFLIDEVHILKEERGATLEAVVSRMKSIGSNVRFVALSATVPNSEDIAAWLGKDSTNHHIPATRERLGEEFRPVRLQKHVWGFHSSGNDFSFDKVLNAKLPEVITRYSQKKPIMVFCFTRSSCVATAKALANWWATQGLKNRYWRAPNKQIVVGDKDLRVSSDVAFHHAGLVNDDRLAVEKGYLEGNISVICCTSTLAVGVNLPCHMVILKNTVTWSTGGNSGSGCCKEYSDLEIMQMLGRAGRPQFDDSAVAVIMTRLQRESHYEKMISGHDVLESCLHRNLIEHLNAEIGLGTVTSAASAKKWLTGTFMYVRLKENPNHYKIGGSTSGSNLDERLQNICDDGIAQLREYDLVRGAGQLQSTEFGDAMARYYIQFETMKSILTLSKKARLSEILSVLSLASEFKDIRLLQSEKRHYRELNKNYSIKFPLPDSISSSAHKVSLIIQAVLGAIDFAPDDIKSKQDYALNKAVIFQHCQRLIRCVIDCFLYMEDSITVHNALVLARSLSAHTWDDSPLHMNQLAGIGLVSVRKLVAAGIKTVEDLSNTEPHTLETALSRNPPFGTDLLMKAKAFPSLRLALKMIGEGKVHKDRCVNIRMQAEIGFVNDTVPKFFNKKPVYVCLLVDTSDGHKIHFARVSAHKLDRGREVLFSAELTSPDQSIRGFIMCDEIAGTQRSATLKPKISLSAFPAQKATVQQHADPSGSSNISKYCESTVTRVRNVDDEFGDAIIDDVDLSQAEQRGFVDIADFEESDTERNKASGGINAHKPASKGLLKDHWQPVQLSDGKWACNHACRDKTKCKHLCCREGLDKQPKPPKVTSSKKKEADPDLRQTQLTDPVAKSLDKATTSGTSKTTTANSFRKPKEMKEIQDLDRLHTSIKATAPDVPLLSKMKFNLQSAQSSYLQPSLTTSQRPASSDYGEDIFCSEELPDIDMPITKLASHMSPPRQLSEQNVASDEMLDEPGEFSDAPTRPTEQERDTRHGGQSCFANDYGQDENFKDIWILSDDDNDYMITEDAPRLNSSVTTRDRPPVAQSHKRIFASDDDTEISIKTPKLGLSSPSSTRKGLKNGHSMQPGLPAMFADDDLLRKMDGLDPIQQSQTQTQQESSGDQALDLEEWFKQEFGTEHFNFIR